MAVSESVPQRQTTEKLRDGNFANLIEAFDSAVASMPDAPAFTALGQTLSFSEIDAASRKLANYLLQETSLEPGDRIAIQLPNLIQYPVAAWAAWRAGLILVNTNPLYTPTELIHQFNDAGCKALIVLSDLLPVVAAVLQKTKLKHVIATNATDMLAPMSVETGNLSIVSWVDATADTFDQPLPPSTQTMDSIATLQYTGGTTGVAKGAVLTHGNLFHAVLQGRSSFESQEKERGNQQELTISPMPLYHIYGFVLNVISLVLTNGHSVLIPNPRDIPSLLGAMKQHRFTGFAGVNTLFSAMLSHPEFDDVDFSNLDTTIAGGAATAVELAEQWQKRTGKPIYEGYGLTETCATASVNRINSNILGTVGPPNKGMNIRLIDDTGVDCPEGQPGELCLQGANIMLGYWQRAEATDEVLNSEGWFRTGDVAQITPEGHIKIVDRIKDMILVSGFNVYPNEIEDVVYRYPGVRECAAIGIADEKSGETVKLFLACDSQDTDAIISHCREHLTAYKVPKHIEFRDELPKSNVGKILRRMLRPGADSD